MQKGLARSSIAARMTRLYPEAMDEEATSRGDFDQFDADESSTIDRKEFATLVDFLGMEFSEPQPEDAFQTIDSDGNGQSDFSEFKAWCLKYQEG